MIVQGMGNFLKSRENSERKKLSRPQTGLAHCIRHFIDIFQN